MSAIRSILLATDFSAAADCAKHHAAAIAARTGATLHLLHVQALISDLYGREDYPGYAEFETALLEEVENRVKTQGVPQEVPLVRASVRDVSVAQGVNHYIAEHDIDLLVIGTHARHGLARLFLGSEAAEILKLTTVPVLVVGPDMDCRAHGYRTIVTGTDFSENAAHAFQQALHGLPEQGHVHAVHAVDTDVYPPYFPDSFSHAAVEHAQEAMADWVRKLAPDSTAVTTVVDTGRADELIDSTAQRVNADLIVVGSRGLSRFEHMLLGSIAERTIRRAPCPVLALRGEALLDL